MKKRPLLIIIPVLMAGLIFVYSQSIRSSSEMPPPKPFHKLTYSGSIGTGSNKVEKGIASFKKNYQQLDYLTLYWYSLDSDGLISRDDSVSLDIETEIITFARQNQKKVLIGIDNGENPEKFENILEKQDNHINEINQLLDDKSYDGIIIDYENLRQDQEEDFTLYMVGLSRAIRSRGKILGISTNVETSGKVFHGINIVDIAKIVDRIHLSIYEQYGEDTGPGPIASIGWTNTVIKNIINLGVDPGKIILGTAHSGHDWITNPEEEFFKDMSTSQTLELLAKTKSQLQWDNIKQANYFNYSDEDDRQHQVWLEDSRSFERKIDLAKAYQLGGIFIWYLGGEDPQIWKII